MNERNAPGSILSSLIAVVADTLAIFFGLKLALWLRFETGIFETDPLDGVPHETTHQLFLNLLALAIFLLVFRRLGLYQRPHKGRLEDKIPRILRACIIGFVLYFAAEAALRLDPEFSRLALLLATITVPVFVLLERWIIYRVELHYARHAEVILRVLVLGGTPSAAKVRKDIESEPFLRARVAGFLRTETDQPWHENIPEHLRLGDIDDFESIIPESEIGHVIFSGNRFDSSILDRLLVYCENRYVGFSMVSDLFHASNVRVMQIGGTPIIELDWPLDRWSARLSKRLFDICFSLAALILASPILLLAALAVKLTSKGPVFYCQERCGEKSRCFCIIKLRTMTADAENNGPGWTTPDDPRRTPVGGFLRRWNIDELPQFINVLLGHMSVVGPRPERPVYVEQFKQDKDRYMRRHLHKPGITGWAQVNGLRGDTSIEERVKYDLFYLENWSLGLDVKIIIKTLAAWKNAY